MKKEYRRGVSIAICCHNSAARLPATLVHLASQARNATLPWEVIVVDNASTDDTAIVAVDHWPKEIAVPLVVVHEPRLGKMYAFQTAFRQAVYEFVGFLDDDNWVCGDWVSEVARILSARPDVGACGGQTQAVCESAAPTWFETVAPAYAVGSQGEGAGDVTETPGHLWGAGLSVRRSAWDDLSSRGFVPTLTCRRGKSLSAGGDSEVCYALRIAGWKLWYSPSLMLQHFVPKNRLTWPYARRLHRGFGASRAGLLPYRALLGLEKHCRSGRLLHAVWLREAFYTLRQLLSHDRADVRALLCGKVGDANVLIAEESLGYLTELVRQRGRIDRRIEALPSASWIGPREAD